MADAHKNFAYSTVATAPSPGISGTSLATQTGDGTKFPAAPFNATIWPINALPLSTNAEIVRVTAISTDTFTIVRAQEGSTAQTIAVGYQIAATITVKTITDVEPVGSTGYLQYYNSGVPGSNSALFWDTTNLFLRLGATGTTLTASKRNLVVDNLSTNITQDEYPVYINSVINPGGATSGQYINGFFVIGSNSANAQNFTGRISGMQAEADHNGTGTVTLMRGAQGIVQNGAAGTITTAHGGYFNVFNNGTGTLTNAVGALFGVSGAVGGTITTAYGAYVQNGNALGTWGSKAGFLIEEISGATNNTDLVIGQSSIPAGTFALYSGSSRQSTLNGPLTATLLTNTTISTSSKLDTNADANFTYHSLSRQGFINGNCEVNQSITVPTLSTTYQYMPVDMFMGKATGTAVSAGTITQDTASTLTTNGFAIKFAGVTVTGSGIIFCRYRMEAKDAIQFKNQVLSFALQVLHDVGSTINYTIFLNKPTAADNYTSTTAISNSGNLAVTTATNTRIKYENVSVGDISNGLEIEVQAACGAVTTKNFSFGEWQLNKGTYAQAFQPRLHTDDLQLCQRYYEKSYLMADAPGTNTNNGLYGFFTGTNTTAGIKCPIPFRIRKRTTPTITFYDPAGTSGTCYRGGNGKAASTYFPGEGATGIQCNDVTADSGILCQYLADARL